MDRKRYIVLACEIMTRELKTVIEDSGNQIDLIFLTSELHDVGGNKMVIELQDQINQLDLKNYDALLLGYGLCNNGIVGLQCPIPMVIPRAHDCIALFMGSKDDFNRYHEFNTGSYYKTVGWIDYRTGDEPLHNFKLAEIGLDKTLEQFIAEYGEENGKFLWETVGNQTANYDAYTFIDTDVGDVSQYKEQTKEAASTKHWAYKEVQGNNTLFKKLLEGDWDKTLFQVIEPGHTIQPSYDDKVIKSSN